jgi:hypothetical protein
MCWRAGASRGRHRTFRPRRRAAARGLRRVLAARRLPRTAAGLAARRGFSTGCGRFAQTGRSWRVRRLHGARPHARGRRGAPTAWPTFSRSHKLRAKKFHLGYRVARLARDGVLGAAGRHPGRPRIPLRVGGGLRPARLRRAPSTAEGADLGFSGHGAAQSAGRSFTPSREPPRSYTAPRPGC